MKALIAFHVEDEKSLLEKFQPGLPVSWIKSGGPLLLQLGMLGNQRFSKGQIWHLREKRDLRPLAGKATLFGALLFRQPGVLAILVTSIETSSKTLLDSLTRPGSASTQQFLLAEFGVKPVLGAQIRATCVTDYGLAENSHDFQLFGFSSKNSFAFEIQGTYMAALVAAERILIGIATKARIKPGFLFGKARRAHALLSNWVGLPITDSSTLLKQFVTLRKTVDLQAIKDETMSALESHVKTSNLTIVTSGAVFSFLTPWLFSVPYLIGLATPIGVLGISIVVSLVLGVLVWSVSKP